MPTNPRPLPAVCGHSQSEARRAVRQTSAQPGRAGTSMFVIPPAPACRRRGTIRVFPREPAPHMSHSIHSRENNYPRIA